MPIRILDEHNESYAAISELVQSERLQTPIALVHVDSHEDLDAPMGTSSCYDLPAREYVEHNLTCGDFILPLLLKEYAQKVVHVNFQDKACQQSNVGSLSGEGTFIRSNIANDYLAFYPDLKTWYYHKTSDIASLSDLVQGYHVVLGIDCDYFSWHRIPRPIYPFRFSTEQQERINQHERSDDEYQMQLRILPHRLPTISGLTFNDSKAWIELFIDYFCFYLELHPQWTIIARSAKSGFTPEKFVHLIEKRLLKRLKNPPACLDIPLGERLEMSPFVVQQGQRWYSFSTHQLLMACPLESIIIQAITNEQTIGVMREGFSRTVRQQRKVG